MRAARHCPNAAQRARRAGWFRTARLSLVWQGPSRAAVSLQLFGPQQFKNLVDQAQRSSAGDIYLMPSVTLAGQVVRVVGLRAGVLSPTVLPAGISNPADPWAEHST